MGKSIEVYIDDVVVKSKLVSNHVRDLGDVFEILRKYRLRLNASKCSFGVGSGKFLGYMVTHRGIEVNADQIRAIHSLQPPQRSSKEHVDAMREEVIKLKKAGAIKEVFYPKWLANTVVVKKKSGKWRVCLDFTDLNKACPKDPFPMPRIDRLVDSTVGHPRMSFLDAFQGYHEIPLAAEDQEKMAFVTPVGNFHYKVMPFGLKNAGSTYQRMMTRMFELQMGKSIEVYIDDMVV